MHRPHLLTRRTLPAAARKFILLGLPAGILLYIGCSVETGGLDVCGDVVVAVQPRIICPGENVTISWSSEPALIDCDEFFGIGFGEGCVGPVEENISVLLASDPEAIFGGGLVLSRDGASGSETVTVNDDTAIRISLFRQRTAGSGRLFCDGGATAVQVLDPDEVAVELLNFEFGCDRGLGGGPGWGAINIEPGEVASSSIRILQVRNLSTFPIQLGLRRDSPDSSIPPLVTVTLGGAGQPTDTTTEIGGPYFGLWSAAPLEPGAFGPSGCESDGPTGDVVAPPGGGGTVIVPRPPIEIQVTLGCS